MSSCSSELLGGKIPTAKAFLIGHVGFWIEKLLLSFQGGIFLIWAPKSYQRVTREDLERLKEETARDRAGPRDGLTRRAAVTDATTVIRPATEQDGPALGRLGAALTRLHHRVRSRALHLAPGENIEQGYGRFLISHMASADDVVLRCRSCRRGRRVRLGRHRAEVVEGAARRRRIHPRRSRGGTCASSTGSAGAWSRRRPNGSSRAACRASCCGRRKERPGAAPLRPPRLSPHHDRDDPRALMRSPRTTAASVVCPAGADDRLDRVLARAGPRDLAR